MRNFIFFLVRHANTLFFILLEGICAILLFNYNDYQKSAFLSSSNAVCGSVYAMQNSVVQYFGLTEANRQLRTENIQLRNRVEMLEKQLHAMPDSLRSMAMGADGKQFVYRNARIINSSTSRSRNYLTADAGLLDGIRPDMIATDNGNVVGLVTAASDHYCTILPIINSSFSLSVKLKGNNFRGQLVWNERNVHRATMIDVPEHATVSVGDTVVTSGSSSYFHEGLHVGKVSEVEMDRNGGFYRLTVDLATDFESIYHVEIVENLEHKEQQELESQNEHD